MEFHLWECYNPEKISVELNEEYSKKIKKLVKNKVSFVAKSLKIEPARLYDYFIYHSLPIPLHVLLNLSKMFNLCLEDIEKSIVLYKQLYVPLKNSVRRPKLPIEIHPYLTSIVANLFFDGSVPKDGRGTYYNQKNQEIMDDFLGKIKFIFGNVYYSCKLDHRGVLKCRIPRIIGEICRTLYSIKNFGTFDARIPKLVFDLNHENKAAFVLSGIVDEGSIAYDGSIIFGVSNNLLCTDFKNLCNEIGLETTNIKQKKGGDHFYLYIKSQKKLLEILETLHKIYPFISLGPKAERLKKALEIKNQKKIYGVAFGRERRDLILLEIQKKDCSVNYLSHNLLVPPRTIRRYMYHFIKEKKVSRTKTGNEFLYRYLG